MLKNDDSFRQKTIKSPQASLRADSVRNCAQCEGAENALSNRKGPRKEKKDHHRNKDKFQQL